ncbi:uncharacterized protein LOC127704608 [Mytilus californianus]|uniref:uncharacterized protein LOC127704608 n=1 Tax=Mytilus californianus TaxID=6549 RepID=UPI002245E6AB|nr:uncharacterized protein LOC127704608 [Mytilus californianus]
MDPNQWRNQAYNSLVQGFPTFDPYISTEQTVGDLSPHAGTRPVPGLSGSSTVFTGPFKPTALTPLEFEGVRQREPDNFGLDLSPPKPLFAQDRNHSWRQPNLAQTSQSLIGGLPTDFSSLGQRFLPPPAHCGISSLHQSTIQEGPTQNNLINSPLSPTFNSQFSERSDTFERTSQHLQQEQSDILNSRREQLLRSSVGNFTYPLPTSQPYLDSVKHDTQFEQVRPTVSLSDHRGDNYNQYFSTGSSFRNPEHLSFPGSNSLHQQSFSTDQRIVSTDPQQNTYNSQRILVSEENSDSFTSNRGPVTIQAVADSTTKPKKGRGRKKKETIIEETKSTDEKKLVDSFIQQEQQLKVFSQKGGQENLYKQSQLLMSGNIYGQNYGSNNQSLSHFSMQSSQISSSKLPDMSQGQLISHSQNMMGAGYSQSPPKHSTQAHGGYDFAASGTMMENLGQRNINNDTYRNSTVRNENFNPQGIASSRNNFMSSNNQHGFSEGNTPMQNPHEQNRILDNNQYSYEGAPNQSSFVAQLNSSEFDALEMDQGVYSGNGNLCNLDTFNSYGQNLTQQNYCANPQSNPSSTVDEAALSSLISDNPHVEQQNLRGRLFEGFSDDFSQNKPFIAEPALPPSAVINPVEEDDEFQHLKKPPVTEKTTNEQTQVPKVQPQGQVKVDPPQPQKPVEKQTPAKSNKNNAFMDSFLSFIQGKKPETLSSVNTAVTKKPQLPKYIPEPKRPRQTSVEKSSDSAASTPKPDTDNKSDSNSLSNGDTSSMSSSKTKMSDDDEASTGLTGTVKNIDTGDKEHPTIKMRIKLQKTPPKQKRSKTSGKSIVKQKRSRSYRGSDEDHERSSGEEYQVGSSQEEEEERERTPSPVVPARRTSARKAKEIAQQKKYKDSESDMEEDKVPETYDSDSDPAWTPVADEKKEPTFDGDLGSSQRRGRSRNTKIKPKLKRPSKAAKPIPAKSPRVERVSYPRVPSPEMESSSEDTDEENTTASPALVMGAFVINKKDLNNFEGFPIWKIEAGKMMRKYELYVEKGEILHRSLSTYSSWLPNMEKNYVSVRTKQIPHTRATVKDSQYIVQVLEEDRPKPKLDSGKETEYEKDPLADMFNVFMQVFLSQAMEPTFLEAIHESGDDFYLKPLKKIDDIISKKLIEINSKVRWMIDFKKTAEKRPHIREVDRPNLKTLCQATENATQNAIKSVHLFGQPYDRTTLKEIPDNTAQQGSVEYLLGKSASHYIGAYHSLHHFKYNLYKRCLAKVDIVREGNTKLDNAEILDKCLNNRTWVLKIFDDLKNMLEKG